ncbi:MAG: hypothetical protein ACRYFS_21585 [Janthinobacterium lividum]
MSLASRNAEHAKFKRLLELASQQIKALEASDMLVFDEILAAKRTLIESLQDARGTLTADPTLEAVVSRIQDADKVAQRLLFQKVGQIMREMNSLNQQEKARGAYGREKPTPIAKPIGFLPDTSMFMDVRS